MATRARFTAEDLWRLPRIAGRRELVDGDIVAMAPVGALHAWIAGKVALHLGRHVEARGGGHVLAGDPGCVLALPSDPERVRAPDVVFVSAARLPGGGLPAKFLPGAPDLAVEVLSPSDSAADVEQRVRDWLDVAVGWCGCSRPPRAPPPSIGPTVRRACSGSRSRSTGRTSYPGSRFRCWHSSTD